MKHLRSRLPLFGAVLIAAALIWGSGMLGSGLPQWQRLDANVHSARLIDYATDVAAPGSRFSQVTRPTYDQ
jgi:hypothetical protein